MTNVTKLRKLFTEHDENETKIVATIRSMREADTYEWFASKLAKLSELQEEHDKLERRVLWAMGLATDEEIEMAESGEHTLNGEIH